jgi:hypothetical protein
MSVKAAARISGVDRNTILSLLLTVGDNCRRVVDKHVRNLRPQFVQADSPREWGDCYTWLALNSETKLILSY